MTDRLLARLSYDPGPQKIEPIPWPAGLAPKVQRVNRDRSGPLAKADVLVVTWTSAEKQTLASVLTPGHQYWDWQPYTERWSSYEPQLTSRSPARDQHSLGSYALSTIGDKTACLVGSNLHLATDSTSAPVVQLWEQMIGEVEPELVITTGTAGGINSVTTGPVSLGDVFICGSAKFNCTKAFRDKPWAQQRFSNPTTISGPNLELARTSLAQINAARLPADWTPRGRTYGGHPVIVFISDNTGDVETVDYFGFADTDDSYDIVADDPQAHTEEMDDCTLPLALQQMGSSVPWLSIRNASDPEVPSSIGNLEAQSKWASDIYEEWGPTTTVGSAIATWATIADL